VPRCTEHLMRPRRPAYSLAARIALASAFWRRASSAVTWADRSGSARSWRIRSRFRRLRLCPGPQISCQLTGWGEVHADTARTQRLIPARVSSSRPRIGHFWTAATVSVRPGQPVPETSPGTACRNPSSGTVSGAIDAIISCPNDHRARPRLKARPSATVRQASGSRRGARHLPAHPRGPTGRALSARTRSQSAEPDHLVSHLILKLDIRKISLSWSPVTESNRRPSPYHGGSATSASRALSQRRTGWRSLACY
jgi:hypothetical protein